MITDDLCNPHFIKAAHHSTAPISAPKTRIAYVHFDDIRMDKACTTATGFVVAVLIPPREESAYLPQTVDIETEPPITENSSAVGIPLVSITPTPIFIRYPIPSAIPEPSTWGLMLVGFGIVGVTLRYKRKVKYNVL